MDSRNRKILWATLMTMGIILLLACILLLIYSEASDVILAVLATCGLILMTLGVITATGLRIRKGKFMFAGSGAEFELESERQPSAEILEADVEPKTIDEDLKQSRKHFAEDKLIPGRNAPMGFREVLSS